jgi:hypothetical protein
MTEAELRAIGFTLDGDRILRAPAGSDVTLSPMGEFFELRISLGSGLSVVAVLAQRAIRKDQQP